MTGTITTLLKQCQEAGIKLSLTGTDDDQLNVEFDQAPSAELITALKANKTELLSYLTRLKQDKNQDLSGLLINKMHHQDSMPLSWQQHGMYFVGAIHDTSSHYNMVKAYRYEGAFCAQTALSALKKLIAIHPILHVQISESEGVVTQRIPMGNPIDDAELLVSVTPQYSEQQDFSTTLEDIWQQEQEHQFTFQGESLVRLVHLQETGNSGVILFNLHHLVADGISIAVLIQDFVHHYTRLKDSAEPATTETTPDIQPHSDINYFDYVAWQQSSDVKQVVAAQLNYWQRNLQDSPQLHQLPLDTARPAVKSTQGCSVEQPLNAKQVGDLKAFAREEGMTVFILLQSVFALLISRYSHQSDVLIGTPTAGREHPQLSHIVGLLTNTVVLRSNVEDELTVKSFLAQNKQNVLAALAHSDVSFDKVIEAINPQRSLSYSPLIQIMFSLESHDSSAIELPDLSLTQLQQEETRTKFDLDLMVKLANDEMTLRFNYDPELFHQETITAMATHFVRLLESVQSDPHQKIAHLALVNKTEQAAIAQLFTPLSDPDVKVSSLAQLFALQAAKYPHNTAVNDGISTLTYTELNARSNKVAQYLVREGVPARSLVAIQYSRTCDAVVAMLGVLKAGCAYVPLDPALPEERLQFILRDTNAKYKITDSVESQSTGINHCRVADILADADLPDAPVDIAICPSDLAYIIYTSGSTGTPKGVMVEQQNVLDLLTSCHSKFQFNDNDRFSVFHSTAFDFSVWEIYAPLSCGAAALLVNESLNRSPRNFAIWLRDNNVSVLSQTPSVFYEVSKALITQPTHSLRYVVFGGEALDNTRLASWFDSPCSAPVTLVNMYGITETTVHVTWREVTCDASDSIGVALPGYQTWVVNGAGQLQPDNVPGELFVAGCGVTRGYLNRDTLTNERFIYHDFGFGRQRFYKTGDLVKRAPSGELHYLGRVDQQIKIRGFRIEPGEIQQRLCDLEEVEQAIVEKATLESGDQLVAFITATSNKLEQQPLAALCQQAVRRQLPGYMVPSRYVLLPSLPVTANGKVDRKKLLTQLRTSDKDVSSSGQPASLPSTKTQIQLASIWADLLSIDTVTLADDFFALGGHSLLITRLLAAIQKQWQLTLSLKQAFLHPGLEHMATLIDGQLASHSASAQPDIQKREKGQVSLASFAQQSLWLACQKDKNSSKYNIPLALKLTGKLNVNALQNALDSIVQRHDSLQMTFHLGSDNLLQVRLLDSPRIKLVKAELGQTESVCGNDVTASDSIQQCIAEEAQTAFDLSGELPIRARLLTLGTDQHLLLLTLHHIATDGWSLDILLQEFAELYNAQCQNRDATLPEMSIGYLDFAHWQRKHTSEGQLQEDLQYWQTQLQDAPFSHSLPLDYPATPKNDIDHRRQAGVYQQLLPKKQYQQLQALATQHNCSVFSALQAAFGLFIAITSDQSDVLLGSPVARRDSVQLQNLMGLFVNTQIFRHKVSATLSFVDLLHNTQAQLLEGSSHLNAPFDYVVSNIQSKKSSGESVGSICQIVLNFIGNKLANTSLQQLNWQNISEEFEIADLDLHLTARENDDGLGIRWLFALDILQSATIESWATQFSRMLDWLCQQPQTAIKQMSFASIDDYLPAQLMQENQSAVPESPTFALVHKNVEFMAAKFPQQVALFWLEDGDQCQLTYQELNSQVNQLARFLLSKGVTVGDRVGICLSRGGDFVLAMLAIAKLGASFVPMESEHPQEHLSYIAEDAAIKAVVTQQSLLQRFDFLAHYPMALMDPAFREVLLGKQAEDNLSDIEQNNPSSLPIYNIYTSGTSGRPKGVCVAHSALNNLINHEIASFALNSDSRVIHAFSMGFDPGIGHLFSALSAGAQVYICPLRNDVAAFIRQHQLTHASLPTALLSTVKPQAFDSLQLLSVGGENCPDSLAKAWSPYCRFFNLYGPTEATVYAMYKEYSAQQGMSIGVPVANTRCFIVNQFGQILPKGKAGELVITGAAIATHYINNEKANRDAYFQLDVDGQQLRAYRTGDLANFDGDFHYLGRRDKQLKIRGYRIEPGQIEQQMMHFAGIKKALVTSHQQDNGHALLLGYFTTTDEQSIDISALNAHLKTSLPAWSVPDELLPINSFPTTVNGKVDEQALPTPQRQSEIYIAPQSPLEETVHAMWQRVLELDSVSMDAEFFDIGGNSLMAMMMVTDVKSEFGIEIEVMDVFNTKSPSGMAQLISEKQGQVKAECRQQADDVDEDNNVEMEW